MKPAIQNTPTTRPNMSMRANQSLLSQPKREEVDRPYTDVPSKVNVYTTETTTTSTVVTVVYY